MIDNLIRGLTMNVASISPHAKDPGLRTLVADADQNTVVQAVTAWADAEPLWQIVDTDVNSDTARITMVRTTRVLRFKDDVIVTLSTNDDGETQMNATSQSRIGKGDLGQNARNLRKLQSGVSDILRGSSHTID